ATEQLTKALSLQPLDGTDVVLSTSTHALKLYGKSISGGKVAALIKMAYSVKSGVTLKITARSEEDGFAALVVGSVAMAYKRKNPSNHSDSPYRKRFRPQSPDRDDESSLTPGNETLARVDPTYGQRGAFPGLDDDSNGEDQLFYGPARDGLEYLRMVRSEAKTVPNLLVAPSQPQPRCESNGFRGQGENDTRGYYADGAYTVTSRNPSSVKAPSRRDGSPDCNLAEEDIDPQEAYYAALCTRFLNLRELLHSTPATSNDESAAIAASLYGAPHSKWRQTFLYATPSMRVLAQLEQESVMYGFQVMETLLTKRNISAEREGRNLGAWCWGLLGRCREVGEMTSEEVSVLRNVGKKALALRRKMRAREVVEGRAGKAEAEAEAEAEEEEEVKEEEGEEKEEAEKGLIDEGNPTDNGDSKTENEL
ncbi:MAG: hypothetical protein Q9187_009119, partial [Circinaria calcarea]